MKITATQYIKALQIVRDYADQIEEESKSFIKSELVLDCPMFSRTWNVLRGHLAKKNIDYKTFTLKDLSRMSRREVSLIRNCGKRTIADLESTLALENLTFNN